MKKNKIQPQAKNIKFNSNAKQPEIRDDLDSRKNQEQEFKGDDVTHNVKYQHNRPKKK
jgi:hypothetical protein